MSYMLKAQKNYDSFLLALTMIGIRFEAGLAPGRCIEEPVQSCCKKGDCVHSRQLRISWFNLPMQSHMVVEEYIVAMSRDMLHGDLVAIAVYPEGGRPNLFVEEVR